MKKILVLFACLLLAASYETYAQAGAKLGPAWQAYIDSLKTRPYKWTFPVWGRRLAKRGFEVPLAGGIMVNSYVGSQEVAISDLKVGLFGKDPVPLDFVKFGEVTANIQSVSVRPDLWVLPFLDLYGIGGVAWSQTSVEVAEPFNFTTEAEFFGYTWGAGTTVAGGFNGFVTIVDLNYTWTSIEDIKGTIQAFMFTPRLGYNFRFRNKPQQTITIWTGAPRIFINRVTEGTIDIGSLKSNADLSTLRNVTDGNAPWLDGLSPGQREVVKTIAKKLMENNNGGSGIDTEISYSLVKKPVSKWSMCVGAQYQINARWQLRTEAGFLGGRKSLLLSGNYRFGI